MRIIAGRLRGKRLHSFKGMSTRPTSDRIRESIFNILSSEIIDSIILDLYAGTGALSLEAISRGAKRAVLLDSDPYAISVIKKNIISSKVQQNTEVIKWDIRKSLNCLKGLSITYSLVFIDPPYNRSFLIPTLENLSKADVLEDNATIVIEHDPKESLDSQLFFFKKVDQRRYGKTLVSFFSYMI